MGNMKVVLFCLLSVVVGTYTLGIKTADNANFQSSVSRENQIQAEEIAKTGVQMALDQLACYPYLKTLQVSPYVYTKIVLGDTVSYSIKPNGEVDKATVNVTAKYNGITTNVVAKVSLKAYPYITLDFTKNIYRGRWDIDRMYVQPNS